MKDKPRAQQQVSMYCVERCGYRELKQRCLVSLTFESHALAIHVFAQSGARSVCLKLGMKAIIDVDVCNTLVDASIYKGCVKLAKQPFPSFYRVTDPLKGPPGQSCYPAPIRP